MDAGGQNTEMPVTDSSKTSVYGVNGVVSGGCKSHQTRFMIVIDLETLKQVSRHPAADSKANLHESSIKELGCPDCFHHFRLHFLASVVIQLLKYLYLIVSHSATSRTSLILRKNYLSAELTGNGWWASVCLMSWIQSYLVLAVLCHYMSLVTRQ